MLPPLNPKFGEWLGFQTFGDPELEKVLAACHRWALAFKAKESPRWLSLIGDSGTGKTHCCRRLWDYAKKQSDWSRHNYLAKAIYWPDFVHQLRAGDTFEMRNEMKRWPVLFLDDVGAERDPSGFAAEELNTLLGCRVGRWTLLTSNLDMAGMKSIDGRIASRLIRDQNICVRVVTKDFASRVKTS